MMLRRISSFRNILKADDNESVSFLQKPLFRNTLGVPGRLRKRSISIDSYLHKLDSDSETFTAFTTERNLANLYSDTSDSDTGDSNDGGGCKKEELSNTKTSPIGYKNNEDKKYELNSKKLRADGRDRKVRKNGFTGLVPQVCNDIARFVGTKVQVKRTPSSSSVSANDPTLLICAIRSRSISRVRNILETSDVDVNGKDSKGVTALHEAAICGQYETIKLLLNYDVTVDQEDNEGYTCLDYAVIGGHFECAQYLINCGASVTNIRDGVPSYFGKTNFA